MYCTGLTVNVVRRMMTLVQNDSVLPHSKSAHNMYTHEKCMVRCVFEPVHQKTNNLLMQNQRHRSAVQ